MRRFKANVILGKKQIILASLVLILSAAVYLNWTFANDDGKLTNTNALTSSADETQVPVGAPVDGTDPTPAGTTSEPADPANAEGTAENGEGSQSGTDGKNLGDALLVNADVADETYFVMARMARTRTRDEAIETIAGVLNDPNLTDDDKQAVSAKAVQMTDIIEAESRIENLIKAKGFEECVVYLTETSASVVVKSEGLDQDQATQIKNIIVSEGKIMGEKVSITEIN